MRDLFAIVNVYERLPSREIKLLYEGIRVDPQTVPSCVEDNRMVDKHFFNLIVYTYEGYEGR